MVALRVWEGWTYGANPITSWEKRLVLQLGVIQAVEIRRIKVAEADLGQIHVVETEHHHLDRCILFQALRMAYICCKTVCTLYVLGPEVRKAVEVEVKHRRFPVFKRGRKAVYLTFPRTAKDCQSLADALKCDRVRQRSDTRATVWELSSL